MKYLHTDSISVFSENSRHSEPVNLISVICILAVVPIFIGLVQMIFFRRPHLEYCVGQERECVDPSRVPFLVINPGYALL